MGTAHQESGGVRRLTAKGKPRTGLRNLAARAEWQKYNDVGGNNTGKTDIDMLSAAILYRF